MSGDRLVASVTFDPERGYVATASDLRQPVTALSLGGLRRRIETAMLPDEVDVVRSSQGFAWEELLYDRQRR
jgi:hypothetical protein